MAQSPPRRDAVPTGVPGLDIILRGGLLPGRIYLIEGRPGTGKTTMSIQYLLEGRRGGERALYVSLLQTEEELNVMLHSHGWNFNGVEMLELPARAKKTLTSSQTLFSTADIELTEAIDSILSAIREYKPQRLVLDSISELSLLVETPYQLRQQLVRLKHGLDESGCTALLTANEGRQQEMSAVETMAHGALLLESETPYYGRPVRRLEVIKMRGLAFAGGKHDFQIYRGGLEVYPRTENIPAPPRTSWNQIKSGNAQIDAMLGGGLEEGTTCLISGSSGAGKSTLASLYVHAMARAGKHSCVYCFDERKDTFLKRSANLGIELEPYVANGVIDLQQIEVGDISPGEFLYRIRRSVDIGDAKGIVIDSINGFFNAMPGRRELDLQLHDLLGYLNSAGVLSLLITTVVNAYREGSQDLVDASYLADCVVLMRHFEAGGRLHRCLSVVKKRHGDHETAIREIHSGNVGIEVGPPLEHFSGVLTGTPVYSGPRKELLSESGGE